MKNNWIKLILPVLVTLYISACSKQIDDVHGVKVDQLYQESMPENIHMQHMGENSVWIRTQASELNTNFPLLPNPTLHMFVYPHLRDGNPVPGYTTQFKLYTTDHYALPKEIN